MPKKPYEDSRLAKYIERRVLELKSKKSQLQIANEAGFPNPNMITMIKNGSSKLAMDRVPSMARGLELDLSRFSAAPSARLSHLSFESDRAFPTQC
jgi:hypothetical protein